MIPLAVHSHYSLLWGTAGIPALCRKAKELGYDRLALTDRNNLYGLWPFLTHARREGLTPIVGAEVTEPEGPGRAFLLVAEAEGFSNLCRLLTRRHQDPDFDLTTQTIQFCQGLVILTDHAPLLTRARDAGLEVVAALARRPTDAGDRIRRLARDLGLPAAAVPDAYFLHPEDHEIHRILRAIHQGTVLSRLNPDTTAPADAYLAPPAVYERRFNVWPDALAGTYAVAERIRFQGPRPVTVMPPWNDPQGRSAALALKEKAYDGARRLYGDDLPETVVDRLEHELELIDRKGFSSYFLVVQSIVSKSPRICGRGSGAASLVAYCLRITNVCPIKHNLYFERFLNAERKDPPDIDVDFAWDERDRVINAVLDEYQGRAAMVSSHILFQPRLAIREVAKVFGLPEREIDDVVRRLPWFWHGSDFSTDLQTQFHQRPETRRLEFPPPWPKILEVAQRIVGGPRHLSVHPGGLVITPGPIDQYVPIEIAPKGVPLMQWEKDAAEEAGLVKIDLLGNRSLGVIRDALANSRDNGQEVNERTWDPEDDPHTQQLAAEGRTMGCFYIESPAMRLLQQKTGKGDFDHLVIHSSIIRPAANEFIREYIRRLKGGTWDPIHPLLAEVLAETFGIMVYQEDVSRTAVALAGFSHADADGLRKVMSKKDKAHVLEDYRRRFEAGARERGVTESVIQAVWAMMLSFSGYSFCKPHSASYARVSFQAAYLKAHRPAEFMAAVISNQGGFYGTFAYVSEARRMGLTILPPDVAISEIRWRGRERRIRTGLMAVKGLGEKTMARMLDQRTIRPFADLADFFTRVRPEQDEGRALIHAGALDAVAHGQNRPQMLWHLALTRPSGPQKPTFYRDAGLFPEPETVAAPALSPGPVIETLRRQYSVLGFLPDRHPMILFREAPALKGRTPAADLPNQIGRRVRVAGWLLTGKLIRTRGGDPMQFLTFEDETQIFETVFFPKAYDRFCSMLDWGRPFLLTGRVEEEFGAVSLTVDGVQPLEKPIGGTAGTRPGQFGPNQGTDRWPAEKARTEFGRRTTEAVR